VQPTQPEAYPSAAEARLPEFGSPAHLDWLARRLSRNIRFRAQVEAWTRLSMATRRPVFEMRP
jgi:hypothetical protein